jgi:hypothetical protein
MHPSRRILNFAQRASPFFSFLGIDFSVNRYHELFSSLFLQPLSGMLLTLSFKEILFLW